MEKSEMPENPTEKPLDQTQMNTSDNITQETQEKQLNLLDLPSEIFINICTFLDANFLQQTLSRVCGLFHTLIKDDVFWKIRIKKRWPQKYPAIPVNDCSFDWAEACNQRETKHHLWSNYEDNMDYFHYTGSLYASVDAVHLMNEASLLAVGSRDRYLHILDVTKMKSGHPDSVKDSALVSKMDAHKGWIWTLNSLGTQLVTGSWDTHVKFWDLAADCSVVNDIKLTTAILCAHLEQGAYYAGGYDQNVFHIDPRTGMVEDKKHYHQKPVLCLSAEKNYIITGSEDKTVVIYDRRNQSVLKTLEFKAFPMSLSYKDDELWVGDRQGNLHLVDATDGDFNIVDTYNVHKRKITGVIHTLGAIFTCSTDKTVKILEPNINPQVIASLDMRSAEIASIDIQNDVLALANTQASVGIWKPRI